VQGAEGVLWYVEQPWKLRAAKEVEVVRVGCDEVVVVYRHSPASDVVEAVDFFFGLARVRVEVRKDVWTTIFTI